MALESTCVPLNNNSLKSRSSTDSCHLKCCLPVLFIKNQELHISKKYILTFSGIERKQLSQLSINLKLSEDTVIDLLAQLREKEAEERLHGSPTAPHGGSTAPCGGVVPEFGHPYQLGMCCGSMILAHPSPAMLTAALRHHSSTPHVQRGAACWLCHHTKHPAADSQSEHCLSCQC